MSGDAEALAEVILSSWAMQGSLTPPFDTDRDDARQDARAILGSDWLAQHDAEQRAEVERAHRSEGIEVQRSAEARRERDAFKDGYERALHSIRAERALAKAAEQRLAERDTAILALADEWARRARSFKGHFPGIEAAYANAESFTRALVSDQTALDRVRREAGADALDGFADTRGVNVGDDDSEWWKGYRQAQRECLHDAVNRADALRGGGE